MQQLSKLMYNTLSARTKLVLTPSGALSLTFPRSTSFVVMTIILEFSCHIILQKSSTVVGRQPWVAMYVFVLWADSSSAWKWTCQLKIMASLYFLASWQSILSICNYHFMLFYLLYFLLYHWYIWVNIGLLCDETHLVYILLI